MKKAIYLSVFVIVLLFIPCKAKAQNTNATNSVKASKTSKTTQVLNKIFIDSVWAANKVSFDLHTVGNKQFAAYYDKDRMMTVASRDLKSNTWEKKTLSSKLVWDSHNYVNLGFDEQGFVHVSGNMHNVPIVYYRSKKPYDIQSLVEINKMTGIDENNVTYPRFFNNKKGQLYYTYRSGGSGNGNNWVNVYDAQSTQWNTLLKDGLFKGKSEDSTRSSYFQFTTGPDGNFHCIWMWRWTPMVETCHQLSYATSTDFINWKNIKGEAIQLPITPDNEKLIVDNVPSLGGLHNGRYDITFMEGKPIISYLKYDEKGLTQLYLATFKNNVWISKKISNWNFKWQFEGGGDKMTQGASFDFSGISDEGLLVIDWKNETGKSGKYVVNKDLELVDTKVQLKPKYPQEIFNKTSKNPKLSVSLEDDKIENSSNKTKYVLKWETMPKSHKASAPKVIPEKPVSALYLFEIQ